MNESPEPKVQIGRQSKYTMIDSSDDSDSDLNTDVLKKTSSRIQTNTLREKGTLLEAKRREEESELAKFMQTQEKKVEKAQVRKQTWHADSDDEDGSPKKAVDWDLINNNSTKNGAKSATKSTTNNNTPKYPQSFKKEMEKEEEALELDMEHSYFLGVRPILFSPLTTLTITSPFFKYNSSPNFSSSQILASSPPPTLKQITKGLSQNRHVHESSRRLNAALSLAISRNELHLLLLSNVIEQWASKSNSLPADEVMNWLVVTSFADSEDTILTDAAGQALVNLAKLSKTSTRGVDVSVRFMMRGLEVFFGYGGEIEMGGKNGGVKFKNKLVDDDDDDDDDDNDDDDNDDDDEDESESSSSSKKRKRKRNHPIDEDRVNTISLRNWLAFWTVLYQSNSVISDDNDDLASAIALVVKVGLDPVIHAGNGLSSVHSKLLGEMVLHAVKAGVKTAKLAAATYKKVVDLGPGVTAECHDFDDRNGRLPQFLALRNIVLVDVGTGGRLIENARLRIDFGKIILSSFLRFNFNNYKTSQTSGDTENYESLDALQIACKVSE